MNEPYIPITIYPPEGSKFAVCMKCKNPCVVGLEEERDWCLMCLMMADDEWLGFI